MSEGVDITWLGGKCPVQAEGTFDGVAFYFRARGSVVTLDVGDWTWVGPEYEWPDAGWISEATARAFVGEAYEAWKCRADGVLALRRKRNDLMGRQMQHHYWAGVLRGELGVRAEPAAEWHEQEAKRLNEEWRDTERVEES